jgi:vitamin B12/bleomycin/antimicrobial peptide transport system ATP-binding/permease protein
MTSTPVKRQSKRQLLQQCWLVIRPYWTSEEWKTAWFFLLPSIALPLVTPILTVLATQQLGEFTSAAAARDVPRLSSALISWSMIIGLSTLLSVGRSFIPSQLQNYWRRWMTLRYLGEYFRDRSYYNLTSQPDIDNPDQRIQEDINTVTNIGLSLLGSLISSVSTIAATSVAVWLISPNLLIAALVYALFANLGAIGIFGKVLNRLNFQQFKKEADFRFSLIRVRNNAEAIAFYQGETQESLEINHRFDQAISNQRKLIQWENVYLLPFQRLINQLPSLVTILTLAPQILAKQLEVGTIVTGRANMRSLNEAAAVFVSQLGNITQFTAAASRLDALQKAIELKETIPTEGQRQIDIIENGAFSISHLTLQTPDNPRILFEDLSLNVAAGSKLLVMGESGCGKSSLLRAIAGIWTSGTGSIIRPQLSEIFFIPQRPYTILGTLREQLLYPNNHPDITDEELYIALKSVNLSDLIERIGGFDIEVDLAAILSLGEQQRLAFARLLLAEPEYAILDEATSALDLQNEANLYQQLAQSSITVVSVGHRPSLVKYHQQVLRLKKDSWQVIAIDEL